MKQTASAHVPKMPLINNESNDNLKAACANCSLRELCVPGGISAEDLENLDNMVAMRRRVKKGRSLFHAGDDFTSIGLFT